MLLNDCSLLKTESVVDLVLLTLGMAVDDNELCACNIHVGGAAGAQVVCHLGGGV